MKAISEIFRGGREKERQPFRHPAWVLKMQHVRGAVEQERLRVVQAGKQKVLPLLPYGRDFMAPAAHHE